MLAYSGLGCLPPALLGALTAVWFAVADARDGDWATACLVAVPIALVFGLVNLVAAVACNRTEAPDQVPGSDETVWSSRHRAGGTPLQSFSPYFLAAAGLLLAGWTLQWVHWPVAVAGYGALTALYYALPYFRRRPPKAVTVAERGAFARARGWAFQDRLPSLTRRWKPGPLQRLSATPAEVLNAPPRAGLRAPFAVMSGTHEGVRFTVADAFEPEPFAPFPAWQHHHVTVCAVHLDAAFPSVRVALRGRRNRYALEIETLRPDFAEALVTEETVRAMLDTGTREWSVQGRDVLTVLRDQPDDPQDGGTGDDPADYDLDAVRAVERLAALVARLPAGLAPWAQEALPDLPLKG
ncbi:hypothetical protein ABZX85_17305 [Streptomyces sp. NPDC004539]|uniref:hypothetical protein n=1 Tax=Streptomyces sp. NPDC004539 TaxID=3154280 RepID=UPI0033BC1704